MISAGSTARTASYPHQSRNLSVEALQKRQRRWVALGGVGVIAGSILSVLLFRLSHSLTIGIAPVVAIIALVAAAIWVWQRPVHSIYVWFWSAAVLPIYYDANLPDTIGKLLPFYPTLATWAHVSGVSFSLNEIFMALVLVTWLLKGIAERNFRIERGSLMLPLGLYILMVLVAELHGLTTGGHMTTTVDEIRSQVYMFVTYVLACNFITSRRQVWTLMWCLVLGAGIRGLDGTYLYLSTRGGPRGDELFPHEQSFFFNGFLVLTIILLLYGGPPRMKRAALGLLPFVTIASLANQRRAAVVAFAVAVVVLALLTWIAQPRRRRVIAGMALFVAVTFPPYYSAFQDSTSVLALPARTIAANFKTNVRDEQSDLYRVREDADIMATVKMSPIIGYGFGKPMLVPYQLPDISKQYNFWNIMPHDSILWAWMRLGTVGYLLLWFLIGTAIVQATQLVFRLRDPWLQGLAVFIVLMVLQEVIFGYLDLQWSNWRNLIAIGILFALISRLAKLAAEERSPGDSSGRSVPPGHVALPRSLPAVDGRVR